jgi:hypothetical protein
LRCQQPQQNDALHRKGEYLYDEEHHFAEVVEEAFIKHEQLKKGNAIPPQ